MVTMLVFFLLGTTLTVVPSQGSGYLGFARWRLCDMGWTSVSESSFFLPRYSLKGRDFAPIFLLSSPIPHHCISLGSWEFQPWSSVHVRDYARTCNWFSFTPNVGRRGNGAGSYLVVVHIANSQPNSQWRCQRISENSDGSSWRTSLLISSLYRCVVYTV